MPIAYIRDGNEFPSYFDNLLQNQTVLLFDARLERRPGTIGNAFRTLDPAERSVPVVVFRGDSDLVRQVETDPVLRSLLGQTEVYVLAALKDDTEDRGPRLHVIGWSRSPRGLWTADSGVSQAAVADLCSAEVYALLMHWEAIWIADDAIHFELPSGLHADAFVRIAEALADPLDVLRIAEWILPYIQPETVVLADTGGLLALLLQIQILAKERFNWSLRIRTLQRYPKAPVDVQAIMPAIESIGGHKHILLIVSVNSSGKLVRMLKTLMADEGFTSVALCDTADSDQQAITALTRHVVRRWEPNDDGNCPECENKHMFLIDGRSYERVPYMGKPEEVELTVAQAAANREFWDAVARVSAARLHWDVVQGTRSVRHHAIYVDMPTLLTDPIYRERARQSLVNALGEFQPKLIVLVKHESIEMLRDLLAESMVNVPGSALTKIVNVAVDQFYEMELDDVVDVDRIMLLDDSIVTGVTISRLRERIYRLNQLRGKNADVAAFAILARPKTDLDMRRVRNAFRTVTRSLLFFVDYVHLPRPGRDHCPWCKELSDLRRWSEGLTDGASVVDLRVRTLSQGGLTSPILMGDDELQSSLYTENSFWGRLDEVSAFCAVSSAMLKIANDIDHKNVDMRQRHLNLRVVFDYWDPILKSASLRTVTRRHMLRASTDPNIGRYIDEIDPRDCTPGLLTELAYATVSGKVPAAAVLNLLRRCEDSEHIRMLQSIIALELPDSASS